MTSRSSSSGATGDGGGRGGGGDQYKKSINVAYRGGGGGGGTDASITAQRRSHFHQRGQQERRLPDAPSDGVIRSASLQHHPPPLLMAAAGATQSASTSAILGTNHIHHHHHNHHQHSLSRSSSGPSTKTPVRHLKKTVRFDNDEGPVAAVVPPPPPPPTLPSTNGLADNNKTWDWLMKGSLTTDERSQRLESAGRDSGVETLTSGEDAIAPHSSSNNNTHQKHDLRAKVKQQKTKRAEKTNRSSDSLRRRVHHNTQHPGPSDHSERARRTTVDHHYLPLHCCKLYRPFKRGSSFVANNRWPPRRVPTRARVS